MNSELYPMIFKRKSFHLFRNLGEEKISDQQLQDIYDMWNKLEPLNGDIRTAIRIVPGAQTTCKRGQQYCVLIYSEEKEGYLQNAGYLGEQLDLYLVQQNIGTLWFGIGKTEEADYDGMKFVIMIAIAAVADPTKFRKDMFKSKRKPLEEIWQGDVIAGVSEIVRFAPSACNTQPWLVRNEGALKVYRYCQKGKRGIMPADRVSFYNRIDIGIFLCFLELCLQHQGINMHRELFPDEGKDDELTLNAFISFL